MAVPCGRTPRWRTELELEHIQPHMAQKRTTTTSIRASHFLEGQVPVNLTQTDFR